MGIINRPVLKNEMNAASAPEPDKAISGATEKWRNLPLRKFFILTVLFTFSAVALLSGLLIWGCAAFRYYLLPDSDSVYLTMVKSYADGTEARYVKRRQLRFPSDVHGLWFLQGGLPVFLPGLHP